MMERGVRGAVTARAFGGSLVVVVLLLAVVAEGQARVGRPAGACECREGSSGAGDVHLDGRRADLHGARGGAERSGARGRR